MRRIPQLQIEQIQKTYLIEKSVRKTSVKCEVAIGTVWKYVQGTLKENEHTIIHQLRNNNDFFIGTYVGLWMGDGTQYVNNGYEIKICSNKTDIRLNVFIRNIIFQLFGHKTSLVCYRSTNQAYIRFKSKFIYYFVYSYIQQDVGHKTYTVRLKRDISQYPENFLKGCLLGLILSDGYLKHRLFFNVTSPELAADMIQILQKFGYHPHVYVQNRKKYGWKNLWMVTLRVAESGRLKIFLDDILKEMHSLLSFNELKYNEPGEIRTLDLAIYDACLCDQD